MKSKPVKESAVTTTEVVCPNDVNPMQILQGGRLIQWMDLASAICAQNHAGNICVTASIDRVSFKAPAVIGDIITIYTRVTRAFTTSMEIHAQAWSKKVRDTDKLLINEAYFTFVAIDENGKAVSIPKVIPISVEEKLQYKAAGKRKSIRTEERNGNTPR